MGKRVCVTGIGLVGPCGNTTQSFWEGILSGKSFIKTIKRIDQDVFTANFGGQVEKIEPEQYFSKRLLKKCSRFSVLSLLAGHEAILDSGLDIRNTDKSRIGIFVGNNSGGWESARNGLQVMHSEGPVFVSPFLASNWFPAAAQGHISLAFGVKGFSKTVIADRASGLLAISHAAKAIRNGIVDIALAVGVETPLDEWAYAFYNTSGLLCSGAEDISKAYKPFDRKRNGMVLAEGAAVMVLESEDSVRQRAADDKIKANIQGYYMSNSGGMNVEEKAEVEQCSKTIAKAISMSDITQNEITLISLDGAAASNDDHIECIAVRNVFGDNISDKSAICPKASFGNTIGASGVFDAVLSIQSMNHSICPFIVNLEDQDPKCDLPFVKEKHIEKKIHSVLVISRGMGGISSAMVINHKKF